MSGAQHRHDGKLSSAHEVVEGRDLCGREAIVTGGTAGIGYETAAALASAGARVVITGRDAARGERAEASLQASAPRGTVKFRQLDHASMASVAGWAQRHAATGKPCHILIDNAGVMACPLSRTEDGFETQIGVNHLAHFAFTLGLLPSLRAADSARVVVLSSSAHRRSDVDFGDLNWESRAYDLWQAYGQSKSANALFAVEFNARFSREGITANAVMPGAIATGLQQFMSESDRLARGWPTSGDDDVAGWKTPAQGAATSVWAATSAALEGHGGLYLEDCAIAREWRGDDAPPRGHYLPRILDPHRAAELWRLSERLVAPRAL